MGKWMDGYLEKLELNRLENLTGGGGNGSTCSTRSASSPPGRGSTGWSMPEPSTRSAPWSGTAVRPMTATPDPARAKA